MLSTSSLMGLKSAIYESRKTASSILRWYGWMVQDLHLASPRCELPQECIVQAWLDSRVVILTVQEFAPGEQQAACCQPEQ